MAIGPLKDIGRDLKLFAATQASFDIATNGTTAGENYPEAGDAIRAITASAGGTYPFATREDKFGTATYVGGIQQKVTSEASFETYLMVNGTAAQQPDIGPDLLEGGGWERVDTTTIDSTIASATDATLFVVASATGFSEGGGVAVQDEVDSSLYHLRRIKTVAGTSITVEPPLPATPTGSSRVVKGCKSYRPSDARDGGNSDGTGQCMTLWVANNRSLDQVESFSPTSFGVALGGDAAAKLSVSGTGRLTSRMLATTVSEPIDAVEEYFNVDNDTVFEGIDLSTPVYYEIDDEIVKVTAVAAGTITVVREALGSSAATHESGTAIVPFGTSLAGTYTGSPVAATSGVIYWVPYGSTDDADSLQVTTAQFDCGFGITTRDNVHGAKTVVAGYTINTREVNLSMSGWTLVSSGMDVQAEVLSGYWSGTGTGSGSQQLSIVVQQGEALGSSVAMVAPRFRPTLSSLDRGAEEVALDTAGLCEGTSSGEDEILLIFS